MVAASSGWSSVQLGPKAWFGHGGHIWCMYWTYNKPWIAQSHSLLVRIPSSRMETMVVKPNWPWCCGREAFKTASMRQHFRQEVAQKKQFWGVLFRDGQNWYSWYRSASIFGNFGQSTFWILRCWRDRKPFQISPELCWPWKKPGELWSDLR